MQADYDPQLRALTNRELLARIESQRDESTLVDELARRLNLEWTGNKPKTKYCGESDEI